MSLNTPKHPNGKNIAIGTYITVAIYEHSTHMMKRLKDSCDVAGPQGNRLAGWLLY